MQNKITYLVGYEEDNEFWCRHQTDSLEKARQLFEQDAQDNWCIYERTISHRLIETSVPKLDKETKLVNAIIAAI
jgi:hypothetical protein